MFEVHVIEPWRSVRRKYIKHVIDKWDKIVKEHELAGTRIRETGDPYIQHLIETTGPR